MLVRSYRTVSPLPPEVAVCFLWHYPASHLGLPLAITPLCKVRTFLEPYRYGPRSPADRPEGTDIKIDQAYVRERVGTLAQNADLSRFIL